MVLNSAFPCGSIVVVTYGLKDTLWMFNHPLLNDPKVLFIDKILFEPQLILLICDKILTLRSKSILCHLSRWFFPMLWLTWITIHTFGHANLDSITTRNYSWNLRHVQSWVCASFFDSTTYHLLTKVNPFLKHTSFMKFTKCSTWPCILLHTEVETLSVENMSHLSCIIIISLTNLQTHQWIKAFDKLSTIKTFMHIFDKDSYFIHYQIKLILRFDE